MARFGEGGDVKHVVMFSGGVGSWMAARRVVEQHGTDGVVLLFTDTLVEDADLHRFLDEAAVDVGAPLVKIAEGRTPFEVFRDVRYLGNSRIAPCSRVLKQEPARKWVDANAPGARLYVGIDWTEVHRLAPVVKNWKPYEIEAPLCRAPYLDKRQIIDELGRRGIKAPRLYAEGFPHNNCGGVCVRAGQAQFAHLLRVRPESYRIAEEQELEWQGAIGSDATILRDRTGGDTKPMTLRAFRHGIEAGAQPDLFGFGGCGCFVDAETPDARDR